MSEHGERFIEHLKSLKDKNPGAMATLRHSLAFTVGTYPKAFPYVERFTGSSAHERSGRRLALYAVAGLFARNPLQRSQSFATSFGELMRKRENSPSIENRFVALLGADPENILDYLRQAASLLAAEDIGCDYARLLDDLTIWMSRSEDVQSKRDELRQRWARDFYRALQTETDFPNAK